MGPLVAALVCFTGCGGLSARHDGRSSSDGNATPSSGSAGSSPIDATGGTSSGASAGRAGERSFEPGEPSEVTASVPEAYANFGTTVALSGDTLAVGAPGPVGEAGGDQPSDAAIPTPAVFVYRFVADEWQAEAILTGVGLPAPDPSDAGFGTVLALEDDTLVVGAPRQQPAGTNDGSRGAGLVYVFARADGSWSLASTLAPVNDDQYQTFGSAIAISDGVIAVADPADDGFRGAVTLFEKRGAGWAETSIIRAESPIRGAGFGQALVLEHESLVAAAPGIERVHVLESGAPERIVTAPEANLRGNFANRVAFEGDTLVVASFTESSAQTSSGAVYVFRRGDEGWREEATLKSGYPAIQGYFGWDLALHRDTLLVAERQSQGPGSGYVKQGETAAGDETRGAVWVFQRAGTSWSLEGVLKSPNGESEFASSIGALALSERFVAVGAYANDPSSRGAGELMLPYAGGVFVWPR